MATRDDVLTALRMVVRRKNINSLEVQGRDRHVFRSPESGHPVSLAGHVLFAMGLDMPEWKRNSDMMGTFEYRGLTPAAKQTIREIQQLERSGVKWSVIADRLVAKYSGK